MMSARTLLAVMLLVVASSALAQEGGAAAELAGARIVGVVHDAQGQPVSGAEVDLLAGPTGAAVASTRTQADGGFSSTRPR